MEKRWRTELRTSVTYYGTFTLIGEVAYLLLNLIPGIRIEAAQLVMAQAGLLVMVLFGFIRDSSLFPAWARITIYCVLAVTIYLVAYIYIQRL